MKIVFVCSGNTCRSSMAEALARNWLEINAPQTDALVASAGLAALPGGPAAHQAIQVMAENGLDLSHHKARQFSEALLEQSDIVLTVTENHRRTLASMFPQAAPKIHALAEFAGQQGFDISDPFGQSVDVYRKCAAQIAELIDRAFNRLFYPGFKPET